MKAIIGIAVCQTVEINQPGRTNPNFLTENTMFKD
jgi:hypothetical protein